MERPKIPLDWCTTREVRESLDLESPTLRVTWTTPENPFGEGTLAVLDTRAFGTVGALLDARRKRLSCPVLVLCAPEEVSELVGALEVTDDIALHEAPSSLLVFQIHRLVVGSAGRDSLTGLADRAAFIAALQQAADDPARMPLSMLLVDVDSFKSVNDTHGHHVGDEVLREAASRLARVARGAVVARLGGDEFGILERLNASEAVALGDQIQGAFKATPVHGIDVTVSVGCATARVPGPSLFRPADEALYAAKANGRNQVVHYDEIARRAREQDRDPAFEAFENQTRVIAERVAELITRRGRKLFEGLKEQVDVDGLTGLLSRRYLDRRLQFEFEVSSDQGSPLTVALLDIDHFGVVNKTHGWPTGDKVLADVAERIRSNTRSEDWAARYGGEEISVVMHGTPLETARAVLERIRSSSPASLSRRPTARRSR